MKPTPHCEATPVGLPRHSAVAYLFLVRSMRALATTASLVSLAGLALAAELNVSVSGSGKADGRDFSFIVSASDVAKTPVWSPTAAYPPLSPRQALEIARKQLRTFVKDADEWLLHEIGLTDMGDHRHWIYMIYFFRKYPPNVAVYGADHFYIPVLMDGRVIKPKVRLLPKT
jgi:hypothetical protein